MIDFWKDFEEEVKRYKFLHALWYFSEILLFIPYINKYIYTYTSI